MTLETVLANLEQAQLVRQIRSVDTMLPVEFGAIYQFKHSLTQEAAYRSLSRRLRQQTHRRVAECYEQFFADKLDEYAAVLAQHYAEAGDTAKAFEYSRRAGDTALRIFATAEAIAHYERALALVDTAQRLTDEVIHLYSSRGRALELAARFRDALVNYQEMESAAHDRSDVRLELAAIMAQARLYSTVNPFFNPDLAQARADRALGLATELGDRRAQAEAY